MEFLINSLLSLLFTSVLVIIIHTIKKTRHKTNPKKLPPGPKPLPILGNLLQLGDKPHNSLANLSKIHGPLMSLKLGQVTTIVISSSALAKTILQTHDLIFCNRFVHDSLTAHDYHEASLAWLPVSTPWRKIRKVFNSYLFTSQKLDANQELRQKKVEELLFDVRECCLVGKAVDIGQAAFITTLNLLSNSIFSIDLASMNSSIGIEFKRIVRGVMEEAGRPNLADYFPVLRMIDPQGIKRRMVDHFGKLFVIFDRMIVERVQWRKENGGRRKNDILDTLLDVSGDESEELDRSKIKHLLVDLFVAGTDTSSSTLEWAMTELLHNPKALSKAKAELHQTIGKGNIVKEQDISRLPYLQAVVKETLRLHPAAPFLLPRKSGEETEICGYTILENSKLLINVWAIGRDASTWENAECFEPERFLGSDIDFKGRDFELIPFGGGRRICPGLPLASRMLHLMLASLVHSFDWKVEDMDVEEKFGLTLLKATPLHAIPMFCLA